MERFRAVAERIAKILVDDMHLPARIRRFPSLPGRGIAGGEKFIVGNVFLKFARDVYGVYGGA